MSHETDRDALARVATDHCHGIVTRDGEMDACGKPAVAIMDACGTEDGCYWPACAYHANRYGPAVPLAQVLAARDRQVAAAALREAARGIGVALLGTTDGDLIDPDSDIPAGEMYRLAFEYLRDRADRLEAGE